MKKLLVLSLVLGIASLASAAISYTQVGDAAPGATFTIQISGTTGDMPYELGVYTSDGTAGGGLADITGASANNGAGGNLEGFLASANYFAEFDGADFAAKDSPGVEAGSGNGLWFELTVSVAGNAVAGDTLSFLVTDINYNTVDTFSATVVPEPATLALLGLGALVLRRKK